MYREPKDIGVYLQILDSFEVATVFGASLWPRPRIVREFGYGGAAPQLNVRQMAADYVKRARLAVSLVKSGDGVCVEFGIADSSGVVFIGTGASAFVHVDPPCFSVETIMHAVTRDAAGPPTPKSRIMLPLTVRDSAAVDTVRKGE